MGAQVKVTLPDNHDIQAPRSNHKLHARSSVILRLRSFRRVLLLAMSEIGKA